MHFVKHAVARFLFTLVALSATVTIYVLSAVLLPSILRKIQAGADIVLEWMVTLFDIPDGFTVWLDVAGVNEQLVFVCYYITTYVALLFVWVLTKRLLRATRRKTLEIVKRPFTRSKPAT